MDLNHMSTLAQQGYGLLIALAIKVLEAIVLWIVGRWLINLSVRIIGGAMTKQKIDPTLIRYINNTVAAILNIVLVDVYKRQLFHRLRLTARCEENRDLRLNSLSLTLRRFCREYLAQPGAALPRRSGDS